MPLPTITSYRSSPVTGMIVVAVMSLLPLLEPGDDRRRRPSSGTMRRVDRELASDRRSAARCAKMRRPRRRCRRATSGRLPPAMRCRDGLGRHRQLHHAVPREVGLRLGVEHRAAAERDDRVARAAPARRRRARARGSAARRAHRRCRRSARARDDELVGVDERHAEQRARRACPMRVLPAPIGPMRHDDGALVTHCGEA